MKIKTKLILVLLSSLILFFPVTNAASETFNVSPRSSKSVTISLYHREKIPFNLSVKGGSGNDINFQLIDPSGNVMISKNRIVQLSLVYIVDNAGTYEFVFDNTFSILSSKQVTFTLDIERPIIPTTPSGSVTAPNSGGIPGFPYVSIIIGLSIALVFYLRNQS